MESQSQAVELLRQETQKNIKWKTAKSLLNTFEETMLQLKRSNPGLSQDDVGLVIKGMIRAVNDLEYAVVFISRDEKPVFEENDNEEQLVADSRIATRYNLIEEYKRNFLSSFKDKDQIVEAPIVLENYIRLSGRRHLIDVYNMLTPKLANERKKHGSGWLVHSLYNFNAWEEQRDRPQSREFKRRLKDTGEIMEHTEDALTKTLFQFIDEASKEFNIDGTNCKEVIEGIENAAIDLHMRSSIGIVWNELINKPADANDIERMSEWFKGERYGPKLEKKAEEIRVSLRKKLFNSFDENIKALRKVHLIRYGSKDDLNDFWQGIAYGVRNFWLNLEDIPYAQKLKDTGILSDKDFQIIRSFIEYFWKEGDKSTKYIGSDGRHNKAINAVVFEKIYDLNEYKVFLGIKE